MNSPEPFRSRVAGATLIVAAMGLLLLGFWSAISATTDLGRSFIASAAAATTLLLGNTGRRLLKSGATDALSNERTPPIVYLRLFSSDAQDPAVRPSRGFLRAVMNSTNETQFALAARGLAPFVAFGRPGEKLEPLGADRIYLPANADWMTAVVDIINQAQLVIVRAGETAKSDGGLLWEIEYVTQNVPPEKILVFLPYPQRQSPRKRNSSYQKFVDSTSQLFPNGLLDRIDRELFIAFTSDWEPIAVSHKNLPKEISSSDVQGRFLIRLFKNYQDTSFSILRALFLLLVVIAILVITILVSVALL